MLKRDKLFWNKDDDTNSEVSLTFSLHKHKDRRWKKRVTFAETFAAIKKKGVELEGKKDYKVFVSMADGKSEAVVSVEQDSKQNQNMREQKSNVKKKLAQQNSLKSKKNEMNKIKLISKKSSSNSDSSESEDIKEGNLAINHNVISKADIAELFEPLIIDPLILTNKKVKRTRDGFQEAITVLNKNMATIDGNLRQILAILKDHCQLLYFTIDKRVEQCLEKIFSINQNAEMFERNTDSNFRSAEKNMKTELKATAEKVKQEFKEKLSKDKFYHDLVKHKIYTESVNSIGQSLVDPMYKQVQEDLDTKIEDLKAMLDIDNRIKNAISVAMA